MKSIGQSAVALIAGMAITIGFFMGAGEAIFRYTTVGQVPMHSGSLYTIGSLVFNLARLVLAVGLGAYVAAWIARRAKVWHAGSLGILMLASALVDGIPDPYLQPAWFTIMLIVLILPVSLLSGVIANAQGRARGVVKHGV